MQKNVRALDLRQRDAAVLALSISNLRTGNMPKIRNDTPEPGGRYSALLRLACFILLLAVLAMAPLFMPGLAEAKAAPHPDSALAYCPTATALSAETAMFLPAGPLGCKSPFGETGAGHSGSCAQHCGAGCSLALAEGGRQVPVLPGLSEYLPQDSRVIGSLKPQPAFRPPRFAR